MPINYKNYSKDWKQISLDIRTNRAKNKCEFCGVTNYSMGYRDRSGKFIELENSHQNDIFLQENNLKLIKIVLTVAHLDHNIKNNDYSNLKALCQKCHLNYDGLLHVANRKKNRDLKTGQLVLF